MVIGNTDSKIVKRRLLAKEYEGLNRTQLDTAPSLMFMKAPPGNDLKEYGGAWHVRIHV
jgi:hypothetical protein